MPTLLSEYSSTCVAVGTLLPRSLPTDPYVRHALIPLLRSVVYCETPKKCCVSPGSATAPEVQEQRKVAFGVGGNQEVLTNVLMALLAELGGEGGHRRRRGDGGAVAG